MVDVAAGETIFDGLITFLFAFVEGVADLIISLTIGLFGEIANFIPSGGAMFSFGFLIIIAIAAVLITMRYIGWGVGDE